MARESADVVRAGIRAWNAGDMDGVGESFDPQAVSRPPEGWPEPGPFVGREAIMRQFVQLRETYDADTLELVGELIEVGDRVLAQLVWRGSGRGPESTLEWTCSYTVRKGKILNLDYFWDHREALETVGLTPD
jgi:ketosteroid isomerase-like protein